MVTAMVTLPHEVLVVDVPFVVLMAHQELLGLLVTQFLPQSCQKMAKLGRADGDDIISFVR